jgi:hypothetical protein
MGTLYKFSHLEYFTGYKTDQSFERDRKKVRDAVNQLIARYNIRDKQVLSIGPGMGYEEYWFYESKCQLRLVDFDETKTIEPYLNTLKPSDNSHCMKYFIGDAKDYYLQYKEKFDICYFSSFTPDERRRGGIRNKYLSKPPLFHRVIKYLSRLLYLGYLVNKTPYLKKVCRYSWPQNANPFHDLVISITQDFLENGGLFIYQSYCDGVDIQSNPHFIKLARKQLRTIGVELLEVYNFTQGPANCLMVGVKASEKEAKVFADKISANPALTKFHGRSSLISTIEKAYDIRNAR